MTSATTTLSWQGRGLTLDTRAQVEELLAGIDASSIQEVHLGGNTLGVEACAALAQFLSKATAIKVRGLYICCSSYSEYMAQVADFADIFTRRLITEIPQSLSSLCDALIDKQHLLEVNLSDNAFGGRSVEPIVPLLSTNTHIQIFRLNNNGLGPAGGSVIAEALTAAAGKGSKLKVLICGRNRLENGSSASWKAAFEALGSLEEVRMPQNGIWMDGVTNLVAGLRTNKGLKVVDLQDNTFTHEGDPTGVDAWAEALTEWPELHTLNLSDCVLSAEGEVPSLVQKLVEGSNPKLQTLSLQNNNLDEKTFELLKGGLETGLKAVRRLELQWNEQEEDDEHLVEMKQKLKSRGGKLFATDEDDEEDEEEKEEAEEVKEQPIPQSAIDRAKELPAVKAAAKDAADELADLMAKVGI